MIIAAIIALSAVVFVYVMRALANLPVIPSTWVAVISAYMPYVVRGVKFINAFVNVSIVMPLALVCLALHGVWTYYRIVLWIVKKIPMLGVSD